MTRDDTFETHDLFREARDGFSPTAGDLDRVRRRVRTAITGGAAVSVLAIAKTGAAASSGGAGVATAIAAAITAGGATTWWTLSRSADVATQQPAISSPSKPDPRRRDDQPRIPPPRVELAPAITPAPKPAKVTHDPVLHVTTAPPSATVAAPEAPLDSLEQEVALVRSANDALKAGNAAGALAIVRSAHVLQLVAELAAIEIDALCALDRHDEARTTAGAFMTRWPRSALRDRVTRSCAGGSK